MSFWSSVKWGQKKAKIDDGKGKIIRSKDSEESGKVAGRLSEKDLASEDGDSWTDIVDVDQSVMAAGCKSIALDHVDSASEVSAPPEVNSSGRRCSACKQLAKDHPGPIGPSKCLVSVLHALTERVEILERELRTRQAHLARSVS